MSTQNYTAKLTLLDYYKQFENNIYFNNEKKIYFNDDKKEVIIKQNGSSNINKPEEVKKIISKIGIFSSSSLFEFYKSMNKGMKIKISLSQKNQFPTYEKYEKFQNNVLEESTQFFENDYEIISDFILENKNCPVKINSNKIEKLLLKSDYYNSIFSFITPIDLIKEVKHYKIAKYFNEIKNRENKIKNISSDEYFLLKGNIEKF